MFKGCAPTSMVTTVDKTPEELRDVFILTILVQEYLRTTNGRNFNLDILIEYDSLNRISKNFDEIEQISRGGHIAIQYKFSKKRDYKVEFTEREKQMKEMWKVVEKKNKSDLGGEIQFEYGERFYNFRKIIINEP